MYEQQLKKRKQKKNFKADQLQSSIPLKTRVKGTISAVEQYDKELRHFQKFNKKSIEDCENYYRSSMVMNNKQSIM